MTQNHNNIGVILTHHDGNRVSQEEWEHIASRLSFADVVPKKNVIVGESIEPLGGRTDKTTSPFINRIQKHGFEKIVMTGYSFSKDKERIAQIAEQSGLSPSSVYAVPMKQAEKHKNKVGYIVSHIKRAVTVLSSIPKFTNKTIQLKQHVLIIGTGLAGLETALALNRYGYWVSMIEKNPQIGGQIGALYRSGQNGFSNEYFVENFYRRDTITIYPETTLTRLDGHMGNFTATVKTPQGPLQLSVGTIVLATGLRQDTHWLEHAIGVAKKNLQSGDNIHEPSRRIVPVDVVVNSLKNLPHLREERIVGIILDLFMDETKTSTEKVLHRAKQIQKKSRVQVYVFVRDIRVASLYLEELYDEVRDSGVNIAKYTDISIDGAMNGPMDKSSVLHDDSKGKSIVGSTNNEETDFVYVTYTDAIMNMPVTVTCDLLGISRYGTDCSADKQLAELTGIELDSFGQMQNNNIHLFPGETNRKGVYVTGSVRGTYYTPDVKREAKAVAETIHNLLKQKQLNVELSHPQIDEEKCALCLTCIRNCPYNAMEIDNENKVARCVPEACQRCGICAGECPAKAIELPVYSDAVIAQYIEQE